MTALTDHCDTIRSWLNFDYDDALIISWTRMAETTLSETLRSKHQVQIDVGVIEQSRVLLPSDWIELITIRFMDGAPIRYVPHDYFFREAVKGEYTLSGNYLLVGGSPSVEDGQQIELTYYQQIPPLGDEMNWLMRYYPAVYIAATLTASASFSLEDERAAAWEERTKQLVDSINGSSAAAKNSGSLMVLRKPKIKGFG